MEIQYSKDDMLFQDYNWNTPSDSHKIKGAPDRNLFTPSEGNEVLYMINYIADELGFKTKEEAALIEKMLHDKLPINKWSQVNAYKWLQQELETETAAKAVD